MMAALALQALISKVLMSCNSRAAQQEAQRGRSDEARRKEREREALKAKKEAEARFKAEKEALFQPVHIEQRAPFGTDPKNIVCINFKNGHCKNGNRCKFSHDLNAGRKVEKKDLYTDTRDGPEGADGKDGKKDGELPAPVCCFLRKRCMY